MAKRPKTTEDIDAALKRWKTRMKRAMTAIDKLERQRKRSTARPPVTMIAIAGAAKIKPGKSVTVPVVAKREDLSKLAEAMTTPKALAVATGYDPDRLRANMLAKAAKLREEMKRKKPVRTKRAPLSTPPASA